MTATGGTRARGPWIVLLGTAVLLVLAFALPHLLDWDVASRAPRSARTDEVPPLHGYWSPKVGPGTIPALLIALLGWRHAADLAERLPWRRLLLASYAAGLAWLLALALVDGGDGLSRVLGNPYEYLRTARQVDDVSTLLHTYVDRMPLDSDGAWPTHVAGHPPAMLLLFVALVRVGLGGDLAAGVVVTVVAATIAVSVLVTLRALGSEQVARRAAPFLVLSPAAVFLAVSADAVIAAVVAAGIAALAASAVSSGRRTWALAALAGLLLGLSVFLSYGMPLVGVLAIAVLVAARSWRPLPVAVAVAVAVALVFAWAGFAWWDAYPVLRERYVDGVASDRPLSYWWWANLACLAVSAGPLVASGLTCLRRSTDRSAGLLVVAAVAMVALADASGMSKAEVERIWLPFVPWLTVACALLPAGWRRWGLALQLVTALVVQHLLYTVW